MGKQYKVWIEIEELDAKGDPKDGGDIGILPDCVGLFEGRGAKRRALAHVAAIVNAHGIDPENSDSVKATQPKPEASLVGRRAVFTYPDYGQPSGYPGHVEHSGQTVTILRKLGMDEADGPNAGRMYEVQAADGWKGSVLRDEIRVLKACKHDPMLGFCKRCGTLLKKDGKCKDRTCPFSDRLQHEKFTEG